MEWNGMEWNGIGMESYKGAIYDIQYSIDDDVSD
jgi:hypothetical protein